MCVSNIINNVRPNTIREQGRQEDFFLIIIEYHFDINSKSSLSLCLRSNLSVRRYRTTHWLDTIACLLVDADRILTLYKTPVLDYILISFLIYIYDSTTIDNSHLGRSALVGSWWRLRWDCAASALPRPLVCLRCWIRQHNIHIFIFHYYHCQVI